MTHRKRKRLSLWVETLDGPGSCDCCFGNLVAGEIVIGFDGGLDEPPQSKTFCLDCVSGVLIEARGNAKLQRRARPIPVRICQRDTNEVIHTVMMDGGVAHARRALEGLTKRVDFDRFWIDTSELEAREQQAKAPPGG